MQRGGRDNVIAGSDCGFGTWVGQAAVDVLHAGATKAQVLDIARNTADLIGRPAITKDDVVLLEDYAYPVYGVPSKETVEAIRLSARLEGMILMVRGDVYWA